MIPVSLIKRGWGKRDKVLGCNCYMTSPRQLRMTATWGCWPPHKQNAIWGWSPHEQKYCHVELVTTRTEWLTRPRAKYSELWSTGASLYVTSWFSCRATTSAISSLGLRLSGCKAIPLLRRDSWSPEVCQVASQISERTYERNLFYRTLDRRSD